MNRRLIKKKWLNPRGTLAEQRRQAEIEDLQECPTFELEKICFDGFLFKTSKAELIGYKLPNDIENGSAAYLLRQSGRWFLQVESLLNESASAQELTRQAAISAWNKLSKKKPASVLLRDEPAKPLG